MRPWQKRQDADIHHSQAFGTVHLQIRAHHTSKILWDHGGRAAGMHKTKSHGVLDGPQQISRRRAGCDFHRAPLLKGGGVDQLPHVLHVGEVDVKVDGVSSGAVVEDRLGERRRRVDPDGPAGERVQVNGLEHGPRPKGDFDARGLRVGQQVGQEGELALVAADHGGRGSVVGREEGGRNRVGCGLGADFGNDGLVSGCDIWQGDEDGRVGPGEGVRARGGDRVEPGNRVGYEVWVGHFGRGGGEIARVGYWMALLEQNFGLEGRRKERGEGDKRRLTVKLDTRPRVVLEV